MSLETIMRLTYALVVMCVVLMAYLSMIGAREVHSVRYPPCYFNPLCSCSKAIPDLGIVECRDVPLPRIPPSINNSKVFMLHLDHNGLRNVEPYFLQSTGLYRLEISNNPLTEVADEAFIGLERSLWELELKHNLLSRVPSRAIRHLQKLRLLDLTGNDIVVIESKDWRGLGNSLQDLILAENCLYSLPPKAFSGLPLLETIDLRGNNLKEIDPSVFRDGLGKLSAVLLADNLLEVIPYEALKPLNLLRTLDVSLNRIKTMEAVADEDLNKTTRLSVHLSLNTLRLDFNQITELETQSFQYFGVVNRTYLNGNPLKVVEDDAFRPAKIRELYLQDCGLTSISPMAFGGLEGTLQILDLSGNNLTNFEHNLFNSFDILRTLSLRENGIAELKPKEEFNGFQYSLYQIDLGGASNPAVNLQDLLKMRNLRTLSLSRLFKSQLDPEDFLDFGIELEDLQIQGGNLRTIKNHVFKHVRGLKRLDLSENKIEKIEDDSFLEIGHTLKKLKISNGLALSMNKLPAAALRPLTNLVHLDISNNKIRKMVDTSFHFLKNIKILELQDNEITELFKGTFQGDIHTSLEEIHLSFNFLKLVQQHSFVDLASLEEVHLDDNRIERLERRSFMNLDRLKFLNLRGNKLTSIADESFQNLPELDYLDLAYNSLKTFEFAMFDQVGTLALLKVNASHNKIKDLLLDVGPAAPGRETGTGGFHSNVKVLDLSYNNISHISRSFFRPAELSLTHLHMSHNSLSNASWDVFGNMPHLQWLDLSHNELFEINFDTFRNTRRLQVFLASNNDLEGLHSDLFRALNNLRVVDLSRNKIRSLPDGVFFTEGLERLDLSHNHLTRMPLASLSFGSASTLCDLDLSHNDIASIPNGDLMSRLKSLHTLDLSFNRLIQLDDGVFASLPSLLSLELSHNTQLSLEPDGRSFQGVSDSLLHLGLDNVSMTYVTQLPMSNLNSLSLAYNALPTIPLDLALNMSTLRTLNLAHNDLTAVPLVVNSLPQLRSLSIAGNPITSLTNSSFSGSAEGLKHLDISGLALDTMEPDALSEMVNLRTLRISIYGKIPDFNIPDVIEENVALRDIDVQIDSETSLSSELSGSLPVKLSRVTLSGKGLHIISNTALQGVTSPSLHLQFRNSSVTVLSREFFKNLGAVRNVSLDVRGNSFMSLENPSTGNVPALPGRTFLTDLKMSDNEWSCNCDVGWVEVWLRKRRQYLCDARSIDSYGSMRDSCLGADDDLRVARCHNKGNSSFLEVLKADIECGWSGGAALHAWSLAALLAACAVALVA